MNATDWLRARLDHVQRLVVSLTSLVNSAIQDAVNTGDIELIGYGARQIAAGYRDALEWALFVRRANIPEKWRAAAKELSLFTYDVIHKLSTLSGELTKAIDETLDDPSPGQKLLHFVLTLEAYNVDRFRTEMAKLD